MSPIPEPDLKKFVGRIFEDQLNPEQIRDIVNNEFVYISKIKKKIKDLTASYSKNKFQELLDANIIFTKGSFKFKESITPLNASTPISKSLYQQEEKMNNFEQDMIMEIAALPNVVFWHRNLERGKGFYLNGFTNHYPDFIVYTSKGTIIVIETKGDDRDNDDSRDKNRLGRIWESKAGDNFKYFMVFQTKVVQDTYTARSIIDVLKRL